MRVCSASDWTATAMQNGAPASGVKTFPDSGKVYTDWTHCRSQPSLGSFKKLTSTFTEHAPNAASWDFAYDVFLDGAVCGKPRIEVMVFEQWSHVDLPATRLHTTLGGTTYDVYHSGRYIQLRRRAQTASGSVDLRAVFQYLAPREAREARRHAAVRSSGVRDPHDSRQGRAVPVDPLLGRRSALSPLRSPTTESGPAGSRARGRTSTRPSVGRSRSSCRASTSGATSTASSRCACPIRRSSARSCRRRFPS